MILAHSEFQYWGNHRILNLVLGIFITLSHVSHHCILLNINVKPRIQYTWLHTKHATCMEVIINCYMKVNNVIHAMWEV